MAWWGNLSGVASVTPRTWCSKFPLSHNCTGQAPWARPACVQPEHAWPGVSTQEPGGAHCGSHPKLWLCFLLASRAGPDPRSSSLPMSSEGMPWENSVPGQQEHSFQLQKELCWKPLPRCWNFQLIVLCKRRSNDESWNLCFFYFHVGKYLSLDLGLFYYVFTLPVMRIKRKRKTGGKTRALASPALFVLFLTLWSLGEGTTCPAGTMAILGGLKKRAGEGMQAHLPA